MRRRGLSSERHELCSTLQSARRSQALRLRTNACERACALIVGVEHRVAGVVANVLTPRLLLSQAALSVMAVTWVEATTLISRLARPRRPLARFYSPFGGPLGGNCCSGREANQERSPNFQRSTSECILLWLGRFIQIGVQEGTTTCLRLNSAVWLGDSHRSNLAGLWPAAPRVSLEFGGFQLCKGCSAAP